MTETVEQSICIKYYQKLGHSCSETYNMIQKAFGNKAMGHTQVKEWFKRFKKGWTSVESDECSGSLSTSRNQLMFDNVLSAMLDNCRITITELCDELGLSFGSVQSILTEDLGMKLSAKSVHKCRQSSSQRFAAVC